MPSESPYKIGLQPEILRRAKFILGSLLLILTIIIIAGVHQGVVSGNFDKILLNPFREFAADLEKTTQLPAVPTFSLPPLATPSATPIPVKKSAPAVQQAQSVVSDCIRKNIREGEFASNKCYLQADYDDLNYYLNRYNSAVFDRDGAESFMGITCGGRSEMFQQDCEKQKTRKVQAEADMEKYKGIIQGIIAKGK